MWLKSGDFGFDKALYALSEGGSAFTYGILFGFKVCTFASVKTQIGEGMYEFFD